MIITNDKHISEENIVLISVITKRDDPEDARELLKELKSLANTAGGKVLDSFLQIRDSLNPKYLLGPGKLQEINIFCKNTRADLIIFDRELTPAQQRNLQNKFGLRVIDRTALILDIFAKNARTNESKLQVELAQYCYQLPRLKNLWKHLEKQEGVIGTRGPGETQLETDKRIISKRITSLRKKLETIKKQRKTRRKQRKQVANISLIGYTNSGKSTLLNYLTDAGALVEDKLFATLTTTSKQLILPDNRKTIITDTVGFIRNLPHQLVDAFKSTLEEVYYADIIIHVVDISNKNYMKNVNAVFNVLEELKIKNIPIITALNKIDLISNRIDATVARRKLHNSVEISALTGNKINDLLNKIIYILDKDSVEKSFIIPMAQYNFFVELFGKVRILEKKFKENYIEVTIKADEMILNKITKRLDSVNKENT